MRPVAVKSEPGINEPIATERVKRAYSARVESVNGTERDTLSQGDWDIEITAVVRKQSRPRHHREKRLKPDESVVHPRSEVPTFPLTLFGLRLPGTCTCQGLKYSFIDEKYLYENGIMEKRDYAGSSRCLELSEIRWLPQQVYVEALPGFSVCVHKEISLDLTGRGSRLVRAFVLTLPGRLKFLVAEENSAPILDLGEPGVFTGVASQQRRVQAVFVPPSEIVQSFF